MSVNNLINVAYEVAVVIDADNPLEDQETEILLGRRTFFSSFTAHVYSIYEEDASLNRPRS